MPPSEPKYSVIVICYNMAREVPRTVTSFLPPYQKGVKPEEVEIIIMENGSSRPLDAAYVESLPANVRYVKVENPVPSPARALNEGVAMARGEWVCPVIDGARIASPGLFRKVRELESMPGEPFIATVGLHLGHERQQVAVPKGYTQEVEDRLLEDIDWLTHGYRLFDIACFGGSSGDGWFGPIAESNATFLRKRFYQALGGYDEAFDIPGGGIVNLDFLSRFVEHPDCSYYLLMGEGTFHQHHGGVTTTAPIKLTPYDEEQSVWDRYIAQYEALRGKPYARPQRPPILYGDIPLRAKTSILNIFFRMGEERAAAELARQAMRKEA